tara:strand:+ start:1054 stop:1371 length:318 start_codon:yes stop_codon:yes gene_type:complete
MKKEPNWDEEFKLLRQSYLIKQKRKNKTTKIDKILSFIGASVGLFLLLAILSALLSSCSLTGKLSSEELDRRRLIDYEVNKLWNEYTSKHDSLMIEYYKKDKDGR